MIRCTLLTLGFAALASSAAAQSTELPFTIDAAASQFTFAGTTSLGPIVGNPNTFGLSGTVVTILDAGAVNPIGTLEFAPGSMAAVSPDINAHVPNPVPFLPALAQINIAGLVLGLESAPLPVDAAGTFTGMVRAIAVSGIVTVTPFGSAPTVTDMAGTQSDPQMISGTVTAAGANLNINAPVNFPFMLSDPGSGVTATVTLTGLIDADYVISQPTNYCSATTNSTGTSAGIATAGTPSLSGGSLELTANALPQNSLGYFLFSADQGFTPMFGGSSGNLCLGGQLFRLSNFIQSSGATGQVSLPMPYGGLPGSVAFSIGNEWNFQYWFRDQIGGTPTSNTTNGLTVTFMP